MAIKNMLVPVGDIEVDESAIGTALHQTQGFGGPADCLFVVGGVTRYVLQNADVPVLMAH